MQKYFVYDKYTFPRKRQTDYSYDALRNKPSQNIIRSRTLRMTGESVFHADKSAADMPLTYDFRNASGMRLAFTSSDAAILRVTLCSGGETFMTALDAVCGENSVDISCAALDFIPQTVKFEGANISEIDIKPLFAFDYLMSIRGQLPFYTASGLTLTEIADKKGAALSLELHGKSSLCSPEFHDNSDTICNMLMPRRNTVFAVFDNRSSADKVTLEYITYEHGEYDGGGSLTLPLEKGKKAYYFNLSATKNCAGRLRALRFSFDGEGEVILDRYSFEQEEAIAPVVGEIISCRAEGKLSYPTPAEKFGIDGEIVIKGRLFVDVKGKKLKLYQTTMADGGDTPAAKTLLGEYTAENEFTIAGISLSDGVISRLPYQFLLFLSDGEHSVRVGKRFYIENGEDFARNPYALTFAPLTVDVTERGAVGDAFTDDTDAIQNAIDEVSRAGGGHVIVPGDTSETDGVCYGRRYIVTNLLMRPNVALELERGAILWQSQYPCEYCCEVTYGHDGVIPGVNWTHCLHVCNLPMIAAHDISRFAIRGGGALRQMDTGSEEGVDMPGYSCGCPDRIHRIPLGIYHCSDIEVRGISLLRTNNYHIGFYACCRVYCGDMKLYEVKCVSGDGFGLMIGTHDVMINRCFFQSNDDGVVITSVRHDPRGLVWWVSRPDESCGVYNIKAVNSYVNSGGGKALAFITWGTSEENAERAELHNIEAYGNYLCSVNPVGTWPDNPYKGKFPFDNSETDDYSPVHTVRVLGNRYVGSCELGPIKPTDFISDCGVTSADSIQNGDFSLGGLANWNHDGDCRGAVLCGENMGCVCRGELYENLRLNAGHHTFRADAGVYGAHTIMFARTLSGDVIASAELRGEEIKGYSISFTLDVSADISLGFKAAGIGYSLVTSCSLVSDVDVNALKAAAISAYKAEISAKYDIGHDFTADIEKGFVVFSCDAAGKTVGLDGCCETREVGCEMKMNSVPDDEHGMTISIGTSHRVELVFARLERTLALYEISRGHRKTLFERDNFFFTSIDFHSFILACSGNDVSVTIDGGLYASAETASPVSGKPSIKLKNADFTLRKII